MADLRLVGAVGIKVRPDTRGFRDKTQAEINRELGPNGDKVDAKATVNVDADTKQAEVKIERFEKRMDGKTITLNVGLDHDSVQRARRQVDDALRSLDNKVIDLKLDRPSLENVKRELRDLAKDVRVKMRFNKDEAGYRSIIEKINSIRREKAEVPISFHTDEASLLKAERKAQAAIDRLEADKTVDIRYSDNYDGMRKAIADLDDRLEDVRKLKITTKLDEDSLAAAKADLESMMQFADVTVKFNEDKEGYETVLSRIRKIQREKLEKEITFKTDDASLREEAAKYEQLIKDANEREALALRFEPVTIEYNEDLEGYKSALDHIKKLQREKLIKKITFNTDDASLAAEVEKYEQLVHNMTPTRKVEIEYSNDRDSLQRALQQIDNELHKSWNIKIPVDADTSSLLKLRAEMERMLTSAPVEVKYDNDAAGYKKVLDKIAAIRRERLVKTIEFDTDDASLREVERKMRDSLLGSADVTIEIERQSKLRAEHEAKELKKKIDDMKASIQVDLAGTELVSAHLKFIGRDRVVNYIARVNASSVAAVEGVLKSLGGINVLSSLGKTIEGMFTKFDTFSLKVNTLAVALGSLASVGVYAGTAAFRVGEGVVQSLGLLAAAPAILLAATAGYTIFTAAFNNFFDAFNKDPKIAKSALEALPPIARKTVDSITGLYKGLANPIQERFWEHVGSTLSDAVTKLYPNLKKGLLNSTNAIGDFVAGFGRSMTKLSITGDLDKMFGNLNGFFANLSKASEPFFDGFNKFGVKGSELLPRFGQWIADAAKRFDEWATTASANGAILDWIEHGANSLKNIWQVGGSVVDIFKAITRAAGLAGAGGLTSFNNHMRDIADRMLAEPWQTKASNIFEGARNGASKLNTGFGDLTTTLGNSSEWLGTVLTQLGNIGGLSLTNLAILFSNTTYQSGVTAELQGMETLVHDLGPSFFNLGKIIGNMGKVAGAVFGNLAPVINGVTDLLASVTTTLADNLAIVAPKMAATVGGIFGAITPLVMGLTGALNGILDLVKLMPSSFVALSVAAAAYFAMRGLSSKFYDSLRGTSTFKNLEGSWLRQQAQAGNTQTKFRMVNGELQKLTVPTGKFNAVTAGYKTMTGSVDGMRTTFRNLNQQLQTSQGTVTFGDKLKNLGTSVMPGVKSAAGGLLSALGGGWGIGLMAAGLAIGAFAQAQADAKAHVDELNRSLDAQTGQFDKAGLESIARSWSDIGKASDGWANLTRGSKAANETAEALSLNLANVTKIIAGGGDKSAKLVGDLDALAGSMKELEEADPSTVGRGMEILKGHVNDAGAAFGLTTEKIAEMGLHAVDVEHLGNNIKAEADKANLAKAIFAGLAEATGTSTVAAQEMAGAMKTIGDSATDAASKIGAINKALDLLHGGKMSAREAEVNAQTVFQSTITQAEAMREQLDLNKHLIDGTTGLIDVTSTSGLALQQLMAKDADAIKIKAQAAYDAAILAQKTPEQAMAAAQKIVDSGKTRLDEIAKAAGVSAGAIKTEWEGFFGTKWELSATFSATADKYQAVRAAVEASGMKWNESAFSAFLKANPDPAKVTIEQARKFGEDYANKQYQAVLKAINPQALQKILEATGQGENYRKGNYTAVMKAINAAGPGAQAAFATLMGVKGGPGGAGWNAAFTAFLNSVSASSVRAELDAIANARRTAVINVTYDDVGKDRAMASRGGYDGAILRSVTNQASLLSGMFPMKPLAIKQFANGGIEQHTAQIARPSSSFRVWAEPETGGEAYIPLSAAKRNRSTAILSEVARQFGYSLSRTQTFEDGGVVGAGARNRAGQVSVNIDSYIQQTNNTADDVARAIMRRVKSRGVYSPLEGF